MEFSNFASQWSAIYDKLDKALDGALELVVNTEDDVTIEVLKSVAERIAEAIELMDEQEFVNV